MKSVSKKLKWVPALAITGLLLTFNNCGNYADPADYTGSYSAISCDEDCITAASTNLEIKPNLGGNGAEYSVPAALAEWNIGGDCNEGGYPYNTIRWELQLNGVPVRNSSMQVAGTTNADSKCVNGRFLLYVNVASITEDPVNRTGLMINTSGTRSPYDLVVEIWGQKTPGDPPEKNVSKGKIRISLIPI